MSAILKTCIRCREENLLSSFYKNPNMADGHINVCVSCKMKEKRDRKRLPNEISVLLGGWLR